jgi:hypothetical protein
MAFEYSQPFFSLLPAIIESLRKCERHDAAQQLRRFAFSPGGNRDFDSPLPLDHIVAGL